MSSKMIYNRPVPVTRVVSAIADKAQKNTQQYGRRPYGVGLLVIGYDETGPHLFEFVSSGQTLEYRGTAIGARSQSSRTYLERTFEQFPDSSSEELILHGLRALRDSLAQDKELTTLNTSIGIVGNDTKFKLLEGEVLGEWLEKLGETSMTAVRARESAERNADRAPESGAQAEPSTSDSAPQENSASEDQAAAATLGGDAMEE